MEFSPSGQQFGINTALSGTGDSNILLACTKCNLLLLKLIPPNTFLTLTALLCIYASVTNPHQTFREDEAPPPRLQFDNQRVKTKLREKLIKRLLGP